MKSQSVIVIKKSKKKENTQSQKNNFGKLKRAKAVRDKNSLDIKSINALEKKGTLFIPDEDFETKLKEIKKKQDKSKRSYSNDIDALQMRRFVYQKQSEYFYEEEKNSSIIQKNKDIIEDEIEPINNFFADCILYDKNTKIYLNGKCFIDPNYMFYFRDESNDKSQYFNNFYYTFPLHYICKCETNSAYHGPSKYCKEILLKDCRDFVLKFSPKSFKEFTEIIEKFVLPNKNIKYFYNSYYNKKINKGKKNIKLYNLKEEFKRQEIDFSSNKQFRLLNNEDFKICETYPKNLIVPYDMTDEELKKSAEFRTKNRLPTLTYRYKNGNCIWRSSQTKSGFKGINEFDILLFSKLANNQKLIIYDARPFINAYANKFKGAGYENVTDYKNIDVKLIFCGMSNIHAVRNAYYKLLTTVSYNIYSENTLFVNIANSGWYDTIIILLRRSFQIYNSILEDNNVLIHCSDGWDRTSQLCSMTQILLDRYYRTLEGFICLIEKDWLSFGHQFRYRNGLYSPIDSSKVSNENQFSPIFLQWLDSLYQLMEQNNTKFEFNSILLLFLAEELYSGKYGTFLFNNEKEREEYNEEENTLSIWNYIIDNKDKFMNPKYNPKDYGELTINYKKIGIWMDYFYKFEKDNTHYYCLYDSRKSFKLNENKDKIIEKLSKFIANKCSQKDIDALDQETKELIKKYIK